MYSRGHSIELGDCELLSPSTMSENPILYDLSQVRFQRRRHDRRQKKALFDKARFALDDTCSIRVSSSGSERSMLSDNSQLSTPSSVTWSPPPTPGVYQTLDSRNIVSPAHRHKAPVACSKPTYPSFDQQQSVVSIEQKSPARTRSSIIAELPGSLLLPSQGFSQSNPPVVPLRPWFPGVSPRGHSAPSTPGFVSPLSSPGYCESPRSASLGSIPSSTSTMLHHHRQPCVSPGRLSSRTPPPIPLSQMTIEELMHILPSLDAALIAHDWVPCMQKRQRELKAWLQHNKANPVTEPLKLLDKNLLDVFDRSEDIAQTYRQLFDIAKKLQNRDNQKKDAELYEATAQKSEALIALSRQISLQEETAVQHERELSAYKDKTHQILGILQKFIKEHLQDAMRSANQIDLQGLLEALIEGESQTDHHSHFVRADIYESLDNTSRKIQAERDSLREICTDQMKTVRQQSQDFDQHLARYERVVDLLQEKDHQNQKLQQELAAIRKTDQGVQKQPEPPQVPAKTALDEDFDEELWARDAEITNLRRKLDKSLTREKELQTQIKQLIQESNTDQASTDKLASRFKRLLGNHQKLSPSIPTMNSMQNLSSSFFTPFVKDKGNAALSPSPKNTRMSPVLPALCDANAIDYLELPKSAHQSFRSRNRDLSPQPPPRLREATSNDEIDDAVSGRFHQMPSHIRLVASKPVGSAQSSYMNVPDYGQRSPRFESSGLTRSEQSFGQFPKEQYVEARQMLADRHNRVLSGITEVTEEGAASVRRQSAVTGSPDSADRQVYLESIDAERALGQRY